MKKIFALMAAFMLLLIPVGAASADSHLGPAIWLTAHQDDETLSYGASIENHVVSGRESIVVLLTDGSASGICDNIFADPGEPEAVWKAECTAARDTEFVNAVNALGATPVIRQDRMTDGTLTEAYATAVANEYLALYPNASIKGHTYKECNFSSHPGCQGKQGHQGTGPGHPDHDAIGEALRNVNQAGHTDVRYYLKADLWPYYPNLGSFIKRNVNTALDAYGKDSQFGVGQTSSNTFCEQYGGAMAQTDPSQYRSCTNYNYYNSDGAHSKIHTP